MSKLASTLEGEEQLSVLMARQPIFSKSQDVVAFELLFRGEDGSNSLAIKDDIATFDVVMNTYANIVAEGGSKRLPCYLKITDKVLLSDSLPELPPTLFSL